jgi:hypothetical protein
MMSVKRIVASSFAVVALSGVGMALSGGIANAEPTAGDYCVDAGGIAVVDDDTPNLTTCYYENGNVATHDSNHSYPFE